MKKDNTILTSDYLTNIGWKQKETNDGKTIFVNPIVKNELYDRKIFIKPIVSEFWQLNIDTLKEGHTFTLKTTISTVQDLKDALCFAGTNPPQEKWINIYYDEELATEQVFPTLYPSEDVAKNQAEFHKLDLMATVKVNYTLQY